MSSKNKDITLADRIRDLDFYKDLPSDLAQPTVSGASISTVFLGMITLLFLSQVFTFLSPVKSSEMVIDVSKGSEKLGININVTFPRTPCQILSLDVVDVTGVHTVDVEGTVHKHRLNPKGDILYSENILERDHDAEIDN